MRKWYLILALALGIAIPAALLAKPFGTITSVEEVPLNTDNLSFFSATTSAQLRGILSDENGTGAALFDSATSPTIITSLITSATTFALINATATTVNFAGAATTLNIGASGGTTTLASNLTLSDGTGHTIGGTSSERIQLDFGGTYSPATGGTASIVRFNSAWNVAAG